MGAATNKVRTLCRLKKPTVGFWNYMLLKFQEEKEDYKQPKMKSSRPLDWGDLNSAGGKGNLRGLEDILLLDFKLLIIRNTFSCNSCASNKI